MTKVMLFTERGGEKMADLFETMASEPIEVAGCCSGCCSYVVFGTIYSA
jgi:hypothetical protein